MSEYSTGDRNDWSKHEVEAVTADYLEMLALELAGQAFNKSARRRALVTRLNGRSEGSIEFKRANISAVLISLGYPYVRGYRPRANYQHLLLEAVAAQLSRFELVDRTASAVVELPASLADIEDFSLALAPAPQRNIRTSEPLGDFFPVKRDYLQREALNRSLGRAGEHYVLKYEQWKLRNSGKANLAERVVHVAEERGDGLGYDVLSFEADGRERLIEVKTTSFGVDTPFFLTQRELALSKEARDQFHLYRLYDFRSAPRFFDLPGDVSLHCHLDAVTFKAEFA
jgi:hypothetical protein